MRHDVPQISLVTGAAGGMGRVVVAELARRGSHVVAVVRDRHGADLPAGTEVLTADLSDRTQVHAVADEFLARHDTLGLLVNNAGAHFSKRLVNADGVEMHVAVNFVAGCVLTERLRPALIAGAPARVVNVVSASMNDTRQVKFGRHPRPVTLDPAALDDLRNINPARDYRPFTAYARSKLLTLMAGYRLAAQLDGSGVTVNAVHPGLAFTGVVDGMAPAVMKPLLKRMLLTPEQAAAAILRVATDPALDGVTGRYFDRESEAATTELSHDAERQRRIIDLCGS